MAIDKYIYISALRLSSILEYRYRWAALPVQLGHGCVTDPASCGAQRDRSIAA